MRILHILDHSAPLLSGYTHRTLSILREQRRLGWDTQHLTSSKHQAQVPDEDIEGFRFHRTAPLTGAVWQAPLLKHVAVVRALEKRIVQLAPALTPSILHAHSPALNGLAALRARARLGCPVVYEVRAFWEDAAVDHGTSREAGVRYRLSRALETYVLRRADAVTAICIGLRDDILARGIPATKVTVIPNAVDVERFPTERRVDHHLRHRLGLDTSPVLGFLGSFYAYEGLELLLEALPRLVARRPSLRTLLVGAGPREPVLRRRVRELGLDRTVVFAGQVPHADIRRYYDLVDVLVYPRLSIRLTETVTPLKPIEAMAMGKLVVASAVRGHRELIDDGRTGLLFEPGNQDDLVKTILLALDDEEQHARLARNARRFVKDHRTWARAVATYAPIYDRLLDPVSGTRRPRHPSGTPPSPTRPGLPLAAATERPSAS